MSPRISTVVLFDIDGTLILTGGAGRRSMIRACEAVLGRKDALEGLSFGGMTDRGILRHGIESVGEVFEEALYQALLESYLEFLEEEVPASDGYEVMPGVFEILERLADLEGLALGLGTGNVRRGAEVKLRHGGLSERFTFGGFGCDHEDRVELIRAGAERGAEQLGRPLSACRVVIVGDTPRDVHAAVAIGADAVGVGTGGHLPEELSRVGARAAFDDLTGPDALAAILGERAAAR